MGLWCDVLGIGCTNTDANSRQVIVDTSTRYVNKTVDDNGWLRTTGMKGGDAYLYDFVKVTLLRVSEGRTWFRVEDHPPMKGWELSLKNENAATYLGVQGPEASAAELVVTYKGMQYGWYSSARKEYLDQMWAELSFNGDTAYATLNSVWGGKFTPIPVGEYKIRVPDVAHGKDMTEFYRKAEPGLRYDQVWFPIEYEDNSRYVHVGNLSEGCVTTATLAKWNALYKYLISHRAYGGGYVGKLIVQKA